MKYPKKYDTEPTNCLREIMSEKQITIRELAQRTGISRAEISSIYHNPAYNMTIRTAHHLEIAVGVPRGSLISDSMDMAQFKRIDPNGFTPENLSKLDTEMRRVGISLKYQVYSAGDSMNIRTRHAENRRLAFSGNFRFFYLEIPELEIVDFDIDIYRTNVLVREVAEFHFQLLSAVIRFAKKLGIEKIVYHLWSDQKREDYANAESVGDEDALWINRVTSTESRIAYKNAVRLGFEISPTSLFCESLDDYELLNLVKFSSPVKQRQFLSSMNAIHHSDRSNA
ncbi:helix-turn-helix domain-containing protein [Schleiferilactobacillus harbinensis]|uniref:Helix-turn-helix domain-containing protein n=1 Tax=Schleiferilactobacillus harbinensis TaxID=304207 RepID=A0ABU7T1R8_9LACO